MAKSRLHQLSELGQSVWIDYLSRDMLRSGELARLHEDDAVVGVTSNPTIFQKAISAGDAYDEQLRQELEEERDPKELFLRLAVRDVQEACDVLRGVWDGGGGQDGYVSLEVDPTLAYDTEATIAEAIRLHEHRRPPEPVREDPGDRAGAARDRGDDRARQVDQRDADLLPGALLRGRGGLPPRARAPRRGGRRSLPSVPPSPASSSPGSTPRPTGAWRSTAAPGDLQGKLAVANAKLAYQRYQEIFAGERWDALAGRGATTQRCLWASTSTKNPAYRDVLYVEELIGPRTVNTMPEETIEAFQDHGRVALTLEDGIDEAREIFRRVGEAGVDYDDVTATLEREGVEKFADSFAELLEGIGAKSGELVAT